MKKKRDVTKLTFGQFWAAMLWEAMRKTGNGYHRPSLRNTGIKNDRRSDKLESVMPTAFRRYRDRYGRR